MKNKRNGNKKKKKTSIFFKALCRCDDNLMTPTAFFAFMQIDSLLLGKVYSACEHLIVCLKLQND